MGLCKTFWRSMATVATICLTATVAAVLIAAAPIASAAGNPGPRTEISCIMPFAESDYHYGATPNKTLTTFSWGSNGVLPIECNGTVNGLTIDSSKKSYFGEQGTETATCTQGAGYAIARLTVTTNDTRLQTLTMPLENTFTGTTFDIAGTDTGARLGAVGSWALPASSAPCPATGTGPIRHIEVAHAFQIYSLVSR